MFWSKKKISPLNSEEYEELRRKITTLVCDIASVESHFAVLDGICKSNRNRISKIKVDKELEESEKDLNADPKYI